MLEKNFKNVIQLRFILQQPSSYWKDFGIDEIKIKFINPVIIRLNLELFKHFNPISYYKRSFFLRKRWKNTRKSAKSLEKRA